MTTMVGSKSLSSPVHRDVWAACHVQGSVVGQCDQGLNNYHIFLIAAQYHPVHRSSPQDIPQGIRLRTVAVHRCDCQHLNGPPERFRSKSLSVYQSPFVSLQSHKNCHGIVDASVRVNDQLLHHRVVDLDLLQALPICNMSISYFF